MTVKTFTYASYYALLIGVVSTQVAYTLYQTSLVVGNGQHLGKLQLQQQKLATHQQQLRTESARQLSLTTIAYDQSAEYQLIHKPIIVSADSSLAAMQ